MFSLHIILSFEVIPESFAFTEAYHIHPLLNYLCFIAVFIMNYIKLKAKFLQHYLSRSLEHEHG